MNTCAFVAVSPNAGRHFFNFERFDERLGAPRRRWTGQCLESRLNSGQLNLRVRSNIQRVIRDNTLIWLRPVLNEGQRYTGNVFDWPAAK